MNENPIFLKDILCKCSEIVDGTDVNTRIYYDCTFKKFKKNTCPECGGKLIKDGFAHAFGTEVFYTCDCD